VKDSTGSPLPDANKEVCYLSWPSEIRHPGDRQEVLERAFRSESLEKKGMKKKIILKDGEREESFDQEKLKEELRPKLENYIVEVLKI